MLDAQMLKNDGQDRKKRLIARRLLPQRVAPIIQTCKAFYASTLKLLIFCQDTAAAVLWSQETPGSEPTALNDL